MKPNLDWAKTLQVNIFCLRVLGLWPKSEYRLDAYTAYAVFMTICQYSLFGLEALKIYQVQTDIVAVLDVCLFIVGQSLYSIKVATIAMNHAEILELLHLLKSDLFQPQNSRQSKMVEAQMEFWNLLYKAFVGTCGFIGFLWILLPLLNGTYKKLVLPVPAACPFCDTYPIYPAIYVFVSLSCFTVGFGAFNVDLFTFALFLSIENQFEILCENLLDVKLSFRENLVRSIKHHQEIIKYATKVNKLCNFIIFDQFFFNTVFIAFLILQAMLVPGSFIFYTRYGACILFVNQIFIYCWFGENIEMKSKKLPNSIFVSSWLKETGAVLKILLTFLLNAAPIKISAFNMFYMSLATFVRLMKSAYSFLVLLRQAASDS